MNHPFEDALRRWKPLRRRPAGGLTDARLQAHWAVQTIAAVGKVMVPPREDWSHTAMTWLDPLGMLAGGFTRHGYRVAVRPRDLCLAVLDADDAVEWSLELDGKTLAEAVAWLTETLTLQGEPPPPLDPYRDDLPEHPVGRGEPFRLDEPALFADLARWFGNAAQLLTVLAGHTLGAGTVRCWPHHFDIATLILLDADDPDPETARSINVGLSPGDGSYDEPYFYIAPWPAPRDVEKEALAGGGLWHTEDFIAAVLPASRLPDLEPVGPDRRAQEQAEQVYAYLRTAMAACRALLGAL
jgi:hypothetical protein